LPVRYGSERRWREFDDGRVGSYRYALLQAGHAIGLLGRSPFVGDAMSAVPSGQITGRDLAKTDLLSDP